MPFYYGETAANMFRWGFLTQKEWGQLLDYYHSDSDAQTIAWTQLDNTYKQVFDSEW